MKKTALTLIALAMLTASAFAETYRVAYTFRGLESKTTVQAKSMEQARHIVETQFPGAKVTGVRLVDDDKGRHRPHHDR